MSGVDTFRVDTVAGITTMCEAFIAAHPTIIARHFRVRPPSLNTDLPCTYLDLRPEALGYVNGLVTRVMNPSIVAVFRLTDNAETMDRLDSAVDLLTLHFGGYPHIVAGSWWSSMTVAEENAGDEESDLLAVRFTFNEYSAAGGRP